MMETRCRTCEHADEPCRNCLKTENERLQADIQYALDRLSAQADQGPGLRVLIDAATNFGDYFPSSELKRRLDQIHEINRCLGSYQQFAEGILADAMKWHDENTAMREALKEEPAGVTCAKLIQIKNRLQSKKETLVGRLRAEIERLQGIVAKLPKTADGVPVTPGLEVWVRNGVLPSDGQMMYARPRALDELGVSYIEGRTISFHLSPTVCYSTPEAVVAKEPVDA